MASADLNGIAQRRQRCCECGQLPKTPPAPRLSTEAGVLLTSDVTRSELQAIADGRREKKELTLEKREEKEGAKVAKATAAILREGEGKEEKSHRG